MKTLGRNEANILSVTDLAHFTLSASKTDIGVSRGWWWITGKADVWLNGTTQDCHKSQPEFHHITMSKVQSSCLKWATHDCFLVQMWHVICSLKWYFTLMKNCNWHQKVWKKSATSNRAREPFMSCHWTLCHRVHKQKCTTQPAHCS